MENTNVLSNTGKPADQITASQPTAGIQVYPPSTARKRGDITSINLPRECRNVRYQRHTTPTGTIVFLPADIPDQPACGVEIVAERNGKCTYVPLPAGTEGIRYRRIRNKVTGVVELTPISWPTPKRAKRGVNAPRTYTGTDIVNKICGMLPCLKAGEKVFTCQITLTNLFSIAVLPQGDIQRVDAGTMTTTIYRPEMPPEVTDLASVLPTERQRKRFLENLTEMGVTGIYSSKKSRREKR